MSSVNIFPRCFILLKRKTVKNSIRGSLFLSLFAFFLFFFQREYKLITYLFCRVKYVEQKGCEKRRAAIFPFNLSPVKEICGNNYRSFVALTHFFFPSLTFSLLFACKLLLIYGGNMKNHIVYQCISNNK